MSSPPTAAPRGVTCGPARPAPLRLPLRPSLRRWALRHLLVPVALPAPRRRCPQRLAPRRRRRLRPCCPLTRQRPRRRRRPHWVRLRCWRRLCCWHLGRCRGCCRGCCERSRRWPRWLRWLCCQRCPRGPAHVAAMAMLAAAVPSYRIRDRCCPPCRNGLWLAAGPAGLPPWRRGFRRVRRSPRHPRVRRAQPPPRRRSLRLCALRAAEWSLGDPSVALTLPGIHALYLQCAPVGWHVCTRRSA
jgi:hypothetical protein